jgi:hypothetical protein
LNPLDTTNEKRPVAWSTSKIVRIFLFE